MNESLPAKPGRGSWFFFRSIARYFVSLFIPCFRFFGEAGFRKGGHIFVVKNYGIQSWLYPLAMFSRPIRFVLADVNQKDQWFDTAASGGLNPIKLQGEVKKDSELLRQLTDSGEKTVLIISADEKNTYCRELVDKMKSELPSTLFMAINGAEKVFENDSKVPKVIPVTMFCGMPFIPTTEKTDTFAELHRLEHICKTGSATEEPRFIQ